jgi:hypothetical protein
MGKLRQILQYLSCKLSPRLVCSRTIYKLGHSAAERHCLSHDSPIGIGGDGFLPLFCLTAAFRVSGVEFDGSVDSGILVSSALSFRRTRLLRTLFIEEDSKAFGPYVGNG